MDFKNKYLKYKNKYLLLKKDIYKQKGGDRLAELNRKLDPTNPEYIPTIYCDPRGFKQHAGECWNDTIQTLICFSDGIKEDVQSKLWNLTAEEIIEYAELNGRFEYLPYKYKDPDVREKLCKRLVKYINLLQNRLCNYIDLSKLDEITCLKIQKKCRNAYESCTIFNPEIELAYDKIYNKSIPIRSKTFTTGVESALTGIDLYTIENIEENINIDINKHLGYPSIYVPIYALMSCIFLNNNYFLNINLYQERKINYYIFDIDNILCIQFDIFLKGSDIGHVVGFFNCNNTDYYYNDDYGIIEIKWKDYLKYIQLHTDFELLFYNYQKYESKPILKNNKDEYFTLENGILLRALVLDLGQYYDIKSYIFIKKNKLNNYQEYIHNNISSLFYIDSNDEKIFSYLKNDIDILKINIRDVINIINVINFISDKYLTKPVITELTRRFIIELDRNPNNVAIIPKYFLTFGEENELNIKIIEIANYFIDLEYKDINEASKYVFDEYDESHPKNILQLINSKFDIPNKNKINILIIKKYPLYIYLINNSDCTLEIDELFKSKINYYLSKDVLSKENKKLIEYLTNKIKELLPEKEDYIKYKISQEPYILKIISSDIPNRSDFVFCAIMGCKNIEQLEEIKDYVTKIDEINYEDVVKKLESFNYFIIYDRQNPYIDMIDYDFIKIKNKIDLINIFNVSRYKKDFEEPDEHDEDYFQNRKTNTMIIRRLYRMFILKQSKQLRYVICHIFFNDLNIDDINKILKILKNIVFLEETSELINDLFQQKILLQKEM